MIHPHDIYSVSEPWTIRITSIAKEFVKLGHEVKLVYFPLPRKIRGKLKSGKIKEFVTIPFNRSKWFQPHKTTTAAKTKHLMNLQHKVLSK